MPYSRIVAVAVLTACSGSDSQSLGSADARSGADAPAAMTCQPRQSETLGIHIVAKVTWPQTILAPGQGDLHIWSRAVTQYGAGGSLTSTVSACGSVVPPLTLLAQYGGYMIQPLFPDAIWDSDKMPTFSGTGTQAGFDTGSHIHLDKVAVLIGASMSDPANGPWPTNGSDLTAVDHDGNGEPGVNAVPRTDGSFHLPPASVDALSSMGASGVFADVLYLAFRVVVEIDGTRQTCDRATGTATLAHFDNHVVGCHANAGRECEPGEVSLLDLGRSIFQVTSATFELVHLPDGATCGDVRSALPQ